MPLSKALKRTLVSRIPLAVSLVVGVLTFVFADLLFQKLLFSDLALMKPLRRPGLYADHNTSDNYWKLQRLFSCIGQTQTDSLQRIPNYDPLLGWVNPLIHAGSYQHVDVAGIGTRTPVLLYGDSFAQCRTSADECFQAILNQDSRFVEKNYLINYGVWGYALDQTCLLYQKSIDLYQKPLVIISLLPEDMDRSLLKVRDYPKPYFELVKGELELRGVPVNPDLNVYYSAHRPDIKSYFLAMLKLWAYDYVRVTFCPGNSAGSGERQVKTSRITRTSLDP